MWSFVDLSASPNRRRMAVTAMLCLLLAATSALVATPARAAGPIETMPLWRLQVRITTGDTVNAGTNGTPAIRLNGSTSGTRTLNPPSATAFDRGRTDKYDLRLRDLVTPSQITMLRVGIGGTDDWCVKRVELLLNDKIAFAQDVVPGGGCANIAAGSYIEYSSANLRSNASWTAYALPPLPTTMSATHLRELATSVTGSAMLSQPGVYWDPAVALTVTRATSSSVRIAFGVRIVDPSGIESSFTAKANYDVVFSVGADGNLHAAKANASCCYHNEMSNAVVEQLDTALSRMSARPVPHDPLRFTVDTLTNLTWRYSAVA